MHVLEIVSGLTVNGAIKHALLVGKQLRTRGHQVTFVGLPGSWLADQAKQSSLQFIPSDLHRWPGDELRRIANYIKVHEVDVIHTHLSRANFFGVLLRMMFGIPTVAAAQSRHFQLHWMFNDHVIAASEATREYHIKTNFVRSSQITTVYNFSEIAPVQFKGSETINLRKQLGLTKDSLLIGYVGHLIPRKGLNYLIDAMSLISSRFRNVHLIVIGKDSRDDFSQQIHQQTIHHRLEKQVHFLGERQDIPDLLRQLDLFSLPSLEESMPLSILEAMMFGLPVVATEVGGVAECVLHEETGFVVTPKSKTDLAQALITLIVYPKLRAEFGMRAKQVAMEQFSAEVQIQKIESILMNAARKLRVAESSAA